MTDQGWFDEDPSDAPGDVTILLGHGNGDFTEPPTSPELAGISPGDLAVGDFNGDGHLDLAVSSYDGLTILLGDGTGDFTEAPTGLARFGGELAVGDFNGDGHLDLAVASGANEIEVLLGDGTGNFTEAPGSPVAVGEFPSALAVGDFDGDGDLDLAVANEGSDDVTILINQSPDAEPRPASEERVTGAAARLASETRGALPAVALRPAVLRRTDSALRVTATADPGTEDAGARPVALARTGLSLPLLALVGSLLLGAGARLRRSVSGSTA